MTHQHGTAVALVIRHLCPDVRFNSITLLDSDLRADGRALIKACRKAVSPLINGDETKVQVLKEPGRKNKSLSWMWVFLGRPPGEVCVRFQYEQNRSHQIPYEFLKDYTGLFQSDDYEGYHTAVKKVNKERKNSICHVLCWAHARRYFYRYYESSKDPEAKAILDLIKDIFDLEKLRTQFSRKGFLKQRKNRAELIFDKLKKKLENLIRETPGGLAFGKAIVYTLDNWNQLVSYVDHFELTPSNNIAERAIRPYVIGRNYAQSMIMLRSNDYRKCQSLQNVLLQKDTTENLTMDRLKYSA